jgi:hypothetical protein
MHAKAVNAGKKKQINTTTEKIAIIRQKTKLNPKSPVESPSCRTRHRGGPQKIIHLNYGKRTNIWHLVLLGEKVLFEESPPSIMVTRNPNWSTEILWFGTGYVKGKISAPLKRSA